MRIISISDTHGDHRKIKNIPDGDVIIHAGDITNRGEIHILHDFIEWFKDLPHRHKIMIAGNHDLIFERNNKQTKEILNLIQESGIVYLQDSSIIIDNKMFYGAPWQPAFFNWAFNLPRGKALAQKWAMIPDNTNVLITHGPPYQILDKVPRGIMQFEHAGCQDLKHRISELKQLQAHCFGHLHLNSGIWEDSVSKIKFVNSAICTESYEPDNEPKVFDIE